LPGAQDSPATQTIRSDDQGATQKLDPGGKSPISAGTEKISGTAGAGIAGTAAGGAAGAGIKSAADTPSTGVAKKPGPTPGTPGDETRLSKRGKSGSRRGRMLRAVLLIIGLAGIIGTIATVKSQDPKTKVSPSAHPKPSASPSKGPVQIGETVEKANLLASVVRVNRNFVPPDPAIKAEAGKQFVAVEFKLTNKDSSAVIVKSQRQFKMKDSNNVGYQVSPIGAPDPKFPEGILNPQQTVDGWIAFQVPVEAKGLKLVFNAAVPRVR